MQVKGRAPRGRGDTAAMENASFDAYSPREIAGRVEAVCLAKAATPFLALVMLGILAGAFIGLGALFSVIVISDAGLGFAAQALARLAWCFPLASSWWSRPAPSSSPATTCSPCGRRASSRPRTCSTTGRWCARANFIGAGLALLVFWSGHTEMNGGAIARTYLEIAATKSALPFWSAFFRGVLCNVLVCMAVWMALAGRSVTDKAIAIVLPISAFVAAGFEHSIANMYRFRSP